MADHIGLLGGSFDPVHNAHLALARAALDQLGLGQVRWIPVGEPWWKPGVELAPAQHRAAMVELAIAGEPRFVLDRIEIERGGPTYTIDTVHALRQRHPDARFTLIVGRDQFASLPRWQAWQELSSEVDFAVADRPGAPLPAHGVRCRSIRMAPTTLSSTAVRQAVAAGADIAHLVPPEVARYIESAHLYRS